MKINKKLGFSILSFTQPDDHFILLLERLSEFQNSRIAIHHDKIQGGEFPAELVKKFNLLLVEPTYRTYWSHINNVFATLDTFEILFKKQPNIDWFLTLTPACYPIKKINAIQMFYNNCNYDALIDMHPVGKSQEYKELDKFLLRDFKYQRWFKIPFLSKTLSFYWRPIRKKIDISPHPFFKGGSPWQGSNWLSINRKVVQRLIEKDIKKGPLVSFYKKHIKAAPNMHPCPQETILQTFIANQNDLKIDYNNYRYINWEGAQNWRPNTLRIKHFNVLKKSNAHWARKFDAINSKTLVLKINKDIHNQ